MVALASIQTGFQSWLIWNYSLNQSRTADVLFSPTIIEKLATFPVGVEALLVQSYLAQRGGNLFKVKRNQIIYFVVTGLFISTGFIGAMLYVIGSFAVPANVATQQLPPILSIATTLWIIGNSGADISVAAILIIVINRRMSKQKGFHKSTDNMVRKITILAFSSSTATAIFASIPALLILTFSSDALHAGT